MSNLSIMVAQVNPIVGDVVGNKQIALNAIKKATAEKADILLFPETVLSGYPADDLLFRSGFMQQLERAVEELKGQIKDLHVVLTYPKKESDALYNVAGVFHQDQCLGEHKKHKLPNSDVFDEKRYYKAGTEPLVLNIKGYDCGILICEDLWHDEPINQCVNAGAKIILSPNASPFSIDQDENRKDLLKNHIKQHKTPIIYANIVGGQDDCVFDGGSFIVNKDGHVENQAPFFEEDYWLVDVAENYEFAANALCLAPPKIEDQIYQALVLGVKDYVRKNGFSDVILGLSGGIDSALTLAICCDALGAEHVEAVLMPSQYTSDLSNTEAMRQIETLGCQHQTLPIKSIYKSFMSELKHSFKGTGEGLAEQNLQARIRGTLLMSLSNKFNKLVITTGNRSELAMGYSTLYGDMAGAFCALKDVPKTMVYRLAEHRNKRGGVIPEAVIERAPSAELASNQVDQDSLPPYDVLDKILELYINQEKTLKEIITAGFEAETVTRVLKQVEMNEYKRKQSPPGVRINKRAFGRDRRYPITSRFKPNN